MSDDTREMTDEWAQTSHAEQVRCAMRKVVCEGGNQYEHALVKEIQRLNEKVLDEFVIAVVCAFGGLAIVGLAVLIEVVK